MTEYSIESSFRRGAIKSLDLRQTPTDRESSVSRPPLNRRLLAIARLTRQKLTDVPLLARYTGHVIVLILVVAVTVVGQIDWRATMPEVLLPRVLTWERPVSEPAAFRVPAVAEPRQERLAWQTIPEQIINKTERPAVARTEPVLYKVRPGDNPYLIATRFGLAPESVVWANPKLEDDPNLLSIGQELVIPPVDGVLHTIGEGDTLASLADDYDVAVEDIVGYAPNNLKADSNLIAGQWVMVPGGEKPFVQEQPQQQQQQVAAAPQQTQSQWTPAPEAFGGATGTFVWPVHGRITQGPWSGHMAIDVSNRTGTPVTASDAGVVVFAGWANTGYGYNVVIDHGNGFRTRYAHLSYYHVEPGQHVNQHELIGKVGSTGRSTGPHLHFEVIYNGVRQNPYNYLN